MWVPNKSPWYRCTRTPRNPPPTPPSSVGVSALDAQSIRVTWGDRSTNESGFEISNGSERKKVAKDVTALTWGGLAPNTYMCFKVRAYNAAGVSVWVPNQSPWYRCTRTPGNPPPPPPSNTIATAVRNRNDMVYLQGI